MDAQQLINEFLSSDHGTQAADALAQQGLSPAEANTALSHAAEAVHDHVQQQGGGLLGEHAGKSFFSAFAGGLVHGDGFFKSLVDGGEGVVTGRVTESIAGRMNVDGGTASSLAAAATPFVLAFLKQRMG